MIVTGISTRSETDEGKLVAFDRDTFNKVTEFTISKSSVIRTIWHPKLNQIFMSCGNGEIKCYYDPSISQRGMNLCMFKPVKRKPQDAYFSTSTIINRKLFIFVFLLFSLFLFLHLSSRVANV
jgi:hypothetical protein